MDGRAGEKQPSARREGAQHRRELRRLILQAVGLVTDEEAALVALLEDRLVQAEGLVRDDQDRTTAVHEACDQWRTRNDSERGLESSVGSLGALAGLCVGGGAGAVTFTMSTSRDTTPTTSKPAYVLDVPALTDATMVADDIYTYNTQ